MGFLRRRSDWVFGLVLACLLVLLPLAAYLRMGEYVIAHDAHLPATAGKALEEIDVLKPINGGMVQGIAAPISFNTMIVYGLPLALGLPPTVAQALAMTATFALALIVAISGFERLLGQWEHPGGRWLRIDACLLGAVYMIAPITLIYMSYGVFWTVNIALAIGILPLLFHFQQRCFVEERAHFVLRSVAALAACVIVLTWSILFIFPTLVMMALAFVVRGRISRADVAKALALGALVFAGSLPALYGMYLSAIDAGWRVAADPVTANSALDSIRGGVLTGFLQLAAWPLYTPWTPRLVLGFPSHFTSAIHATTALSLVGVAIALPLLDNRPVAVRRYQYVMLLLLVAVFLVKGAGQPFGAAFRAILEHVPGAGLIRTPDTKLGVFVILALACVAALALSNGDRQLRWMRVVVRVIILASALYHAAPLVTGSALLARDSQLAGGGGRGYAVMPTSAERRIAEILDAEPSAGVVMLPPGLGIATKREGGIFAYRHVITEFVSNPFFYADWNEAPSDAVRQRLDTAVQGGDWKALAELGVGFVVVDRNAFAANAVQYALYGAITRSREAWVPLLDEGGYEVYGLAEPYRKPFADMVAADGPKALDVISRNGWFALLGTDAIAAPFSVTLRVPENRHWALLVLPEDCLGNAALCAARSFFLKDRSTVRSQSPWAELSNHWEVGPASTRATPGGLPSMPQRMVAVFVPQLLMLLFMVVSVATLIACVYLAAGRKAARPGFGGVA
jgi:hypothetical protein